MNYKSENNILISFPLFLRNNRRQCWCTCSHRIRRLNSRFYSKFFLIYVKRIFISFPSIQSMLYYYIIIFLLPVVIVEIFILFQIYLLSFSWAVDLGCSGGANFDFISSSVKFRAQWVQWGTWIFNTAFFQHTYLLSIINQQLSVL